MNLELIVTIVLAMISSLIPTVYKRITDSANIANPYIIVAAVILGTLSACIVYSLMTLGLLGTLYYFVVYIVILGSIFLTQYLVKLNSKWDNLYLFTIDSKNTHFVGTISYEEKPSVALDKLKKLK